MSTTYPGTIQEAVERLLEWPWATDQRNLDLLRGWTDDELVTAHFGLGMAIRNEFGLWGRNDALLHACGVSQSDDASHVIIRALRARLLETATPEDMVRAERAAEDWRSERLSQRQAEAMRDAAITDRRCTQCGMPCPRYRKTCKACGYEMGREP